MSEKTPDVQNVTELPEQPNFLARNKSRILKGAAITGGVLLGGAYLKRKLNGSCSANVDAHVETAPDTNTDN